VYCFDSISYAGFSLGGLSAIDTVWNHPTFFQLQVFFPARLWWRSKDLNDGYDEEKDRIMHQQVQEGKYHQVSVFTLLQVHRMKLPTGITMASLIPLMIPWG
jgi:enterochelin esterase-like enzyme